MRTSTLTATALFYTATISTGRVLQASDSKVPDGMTLLCNPENPDECVAVPMEGEGQNSSGRAVLKNEDSPKTLPDGMKLLCNPDDPSDCVAVPTGDSSNNEMLTDTEEGYTWLCMPEDPEQCVVVPLSEGVSFNGMLGSSSELDDKLRWLCNPDDPTDCVAVPKPSETDQYKEKLRLYKLCLSEGALNCMEPKEDDYFGPLMGTDGNDRNFMDGLNDFMNGGEDGAMGLSLAFSVLALAQALL